MDFLQDFSNGPVPENKGPRFKWLYLTNVENAVTVCVPVFMLGAMLGANLPAHALLLALGLAGILLSLLSGWTSYIGVKTRLTTSLLVKQSFGTQGVKIVWLLLAISLFGWFGIQTEICAKTFLLLAKKIAPEMTFNPTLVTVITGLLMASTAIAGIKGVGKLAQLSIPLLLGVMAYALIEALSAGTNDVWLTAIPSNPMSVGAAVAAIVGAYAVGVVVMPDIKRFAADAKHSIVSGVLAMGLCYPLLLLCTALTTALLHQADYLEILVNLGLGSLTLIILILATWTTNDLNLYSASLNLATLFPRVPRAWLTALAGILGTGLATLGLFERMIPLFILFGVFAIPLLAIYSLDFLGGRSEYHATRRFVPAAFAVWAVSSFIGIAAMPPEQMGLGLLPSLTSVGGLDAMLAAIVLSAGRLVWAKVNTR